MSDSVFFIESLTDDDWKKIRALAIQIHDSGQFGGDQMKAGIHAFLIWLGQQEGHLAIPEVGDEETRH